MAFATGYEKDLKPVGSGEIHGGPHTIYGTSDFENGLIIGRFAKVDGAASIHNVDGSATPVIAGVVQRMASYPVEDGNAIDTNLYANASVVVAGFVSVDAIESENPGLFAPIYAVNTAGANAGKASITSGGNVLTGARFVQKLSDDVWLVQMTGQPPSGVTVNNVNFMTPDQYTVATVPAAGDNAGLVVLVTDGAAGEQVLAFSDGAAWIKLDGTGAVIDDGE